MCPRLTKIYTRTGDDGTTGLADNSRVLKTDCRVEIFGTLDELNSAIGVVLAQEKIPTLIRETLTLIQNQLFDLGSEFCLPGYVAIQDHHVDHLEKVLDTLNEKLPSLKEFILPGGSQAAALCHVARTVCRRTERLMVDLMQKQTINSASLKYINRLSDLLFVMARSMNHELGLPEPMWQAGKKM
jgi:cob(I)alamin adenosyltransferase